MRHLRDDFAALVAAGDDADLGRAALEIGRIATPDLDPGRWLDQLDALAAAARRRLVPGASSEHAASEIAAFLFADCGFQGNREDYYDPRNSFLSDVLERRTGIPITLSVVLLEVARRCGLGLEGVGFPGHFLVRVPGPGGGLLLDPFFGGRPIGAAELLTRYQSMAACGGGRRPERLPPDALATTPISGILARILRNLLRIYLDRKAHAEALAAVDLLLVLVPESASDVRVRGLLWEQLECYGAALADLRRYLALAPDAPDAAQMRERLADLERAAAAIH